MKKLMIALAAIGISVAANAASSVWSMYVYDMPSRGDGFYNGSVTISCEALAFSQVVDVVDGYAGLLDVPLTVDSTDSYYTFVLTASEVVPGGTWNYVDGYEDNGYVDYNGNGLLGFYAGGEWAFTPTPVPPGPTPTPEPTSGLLLLLGVAGLALRRKQK